MFSTTTESHIFSKLYHNFWGTLITIFVCTPKPNKAKSNKPTCHKGISTGYTSVAVCVCARFLPEWKIKADEYYKMCHKNIIAFREPIKAILPLLVVSGAVRHVLPLVFFTVSAVFITSNSWCRLQFSADNLISFYLSSTVQMSFSSVNITGRCPEI